MQTIELQQPRSTNEQMVAEPTPQIQQRDVRLFTLLPSAKIYKTNATQNSSSDIEAQKPRLGMRGGGILLDL